MPETKLEKTNIYDNPHPYDSLEYWKTEALYWDARADAWRESSEDWCDRYWLLKYGCKSPHVK